VDPERAASICRTLVQEYLSAADLREAKTAVDEQLHPDQRHIVVAQAITKALSDNKNRKQIAEMCVGLFNENVLTRGDFERGLEQALQTVDADFISDDCPKAPEFLGTMLGIWIEARCVDLPVLPTAAAHLLESGDTANIFMHTCQGLYDALKDDVHTTRTLIESGGANVLSLFGQADEEGNVKEAARLFQRRPLMLQLYPTMPYESELRHGIRQALQGPAAPFVSVLSAHASDHSHPSFLRSVVESILVVAGADAAAIGRLFAGLHSAVGATSVVAQLGAMQTASSFLTSPSAPHGLLRSIFEHARQTGLVSDPSVWAQVEDDAQQLALATPADFKDALQAMA
jgi:hypothetical protein